jgi:hypothetical protein
MAIKARVYKYVPFREFSKMIISSWDMTALSFSSGLGGLTTLAIFPRNYCNKERLAEVFYQKY